MAFGYLNGIKSRLIGQAFQLKYTNSLLFSDVAPSRLIEAD